MSCQGCISTNLYTECQKRLKWRVGSLDANLCARLLAVCFSLDIIWGKSGERLGREEIGVRHRVSRTSTQTLFVHTTNYAFASLYARRTVRKKNRPLLVVYLRADVSTAALKLHVQNTS